MKRNLQNPPITYNSCFKMLGRLLVVAITLFSFNIKAAATVDLALSGSVSTDSVNTGVSFVYTLNYSISSLTDNGQNVKVVMTLPTNMTVSGGVAGVSFDKSQIASVGIVGSVVTITMVNPIAAGSTGQLQIALVYTAGTTAYGYTPAISAQISGTNASFSPVSSGVSYVKALAAKNIQLTKTANTTNASTGNAFTYTIAYTNGGASSGGLNLYSTVISDTLPAGCVYVSATAFGTVNPTYDAVHNVVSWKWSNTALSASGSATITVRYNSPNFTDTSIVTNCVTLSANCPVLPLGSFAAIAPITACGNGQLIPPYMDGTTSGTTITTITGLCAGTVMVGTNAGFATGWKNTGNTNLDSVVVTYNIDDNVDLWSVNANYVKDALAPATPPALLITKYYATNLHAGYTAIGTYKNADIYNGVVDVADTPVLATGEYVTSVKILVTSSGTRMIEPNMSEDLTYTVRARTGAEGGKSGATLVEGSKNLSNCKTIIQGSYAQNCYTTDLYFNGAHKSLTNPCTSVSIVSASMAGATTGTTITSSYAGLCSGTVMPGTTITFTEGWKNSGNSNLDSVVVTYNVDNSVDLVSLNANYVKDAASSTPPDLTVTKYYATNLNPVFTSLGSYSNIDIYNKVVKSADTLSLAAGEYITQVKVVTQSTSNRAIEPNMNQDLSYKATVRSAAQGTKSGTAITEGSRNPANCAVIIPGTVIQNCYNAVIYLNGVGLALTNACGSAKIVSPLPVFTGLNKAIINSSNNKFAPGDTVHWQLRMYQIGLGYATNVSWVDSLPAKLSYVPGSAKIKFGVSKTLVPLSNVTYIAPKVTFTVDTVKSGDSVWITFDTRIADGTAAGTIANSAKLLSTNSYVNSGTITISGSQSATILSSAAYTSKLGQNGCDTTTYVYYPTSAHATPQGKINYRAVLKNTGNIAAKQVTLVDVFPYIGDGRGSQYFANLSAPITFSDPNIIIYYDTVSNPCLTDFTPAINGAGCKTANWSVVAPADITSVKAIKLTRNAVLNPLDSIVFNWPMVLPVGVPGSLTMFNSFTYQFSRADNNSQLLPATPNKVGMVADCIANLGSIGNYVWVDSNFNGLQDETVSAGLNGMKIFLYKAGPSNTVGGNDAVLVDSTLTADDFFGKPGYYSFINLTGGNYFVKFPVAPLGYRLTQSNQSIKVNNNSDADPTNGYSELITIDVNGAGFDRDNYSIDAGYIPCLKAINATVNDVTCYGLTNGSILITPVSNYGTVNYVWNDGANTQNRMNIGADTFSVVATDGLGCAVNASYIVNQPTKVTVGVVSGLDSLCLDSAVVFTDTTINGIWTVTDTTILKIDSITGSVVPSGVGNANVVYSLQVGNCTYSQSKLVVVTDCSGEVNSGVTGGVESKSLGTAIADRVYNKAINSISNIVDYAKMPKVNSIPSIMVMGTGSYLGLKDLLPSKYSVKLVLQHNIDVYTSSPSDLVNFTNALEVQAQDYTDNNVCKAVALATKTSGMVYAHTKPICDRLRGAQLLDVKTISVNNIGLIQYKLLQEDGNTEYAISFSAGRNNNTALYTIQSIWLNENFAGYDTMYNFQLWSSSSTVLKSMAQNVIDNLSSNLPVTQITVASIPETYIVSHERVGKDFNFKIRNNSANTTFNIQMNINNTELPSTSTAVKNIPVTVNPFGETTVSVKMNDSYEADVRLIQNNKDADLVYTNDGTWNISYSNNTTVSQYSVSNDTLTPQVDELRLFRNVSLNAVSSDYISVYRLLKSAGAPKDVTDYKGIKFTASATGAGSMRITLVKNSIADWNSQYSIDVPVQNGTNDYVVSLSDFAAAGVHGLNASDITTINFAFQINSGVKSNVALTLNNVRFAKSLSVSPTNLNSKNISIVPNPTNGKFDCKLVSDKVGSYTLKIISLTTGLTMFTMPVQLTAGENTVKVNMNEQVREHGVYLLKLEGESGGNYNPTKLVIIR